MSVTVWLQSGIGTMICAKCGENNPDDAYSCQRCRHKLQSRRGERREKADDERLELSGELWDEMAEFRARLRKYLEASIYALLLVAAALAHVVFDVPWPYVVGAAAAIALVAWLRKV